MGQNQTTASSDQQQQQQHEEEKEEEKRRASAMQLILPSFVGSWCPVQELVGYGEYSIGKDIHGDGDGGEMSREERAAYDFNPLNDFKRMFSFVRGFLPAFSKQKTPEEVEEEEEEEARKAKKATAVTKVTISMYTQKQALEWKRIESMFQTMRARRKQNRKQTEGAAAAAAAAGEGGRGGMERREEADDRVNEDALIEAIVSPQVEKTLCMFAQARSSPKEIFNFIKKNIRTEIEQETQLSFDSTTSAQVFSMYFSTMSDLEVGNHVCFSIIPQKNQVITSRDGSMVGILQSKLFARALLAAYFTRDPINASLRNTVLAELSGKSKSKSKNRSRLDRD